MESKKGQSLVEVVFSGGIIMVTLTGAVVLLLNLINQRTKGYDRGRAMQLGEKVMEQMVEEKKNDAGQFWRLQNRSNQTASGFSGYVYSVDFTNVANNPSFPNCGVGITDCANVVVSVGWSGSMGESGVLLQRFFYLNGI